MVRILADRSFILMYVETGNDSPILQSHFVLSKPWLPSRDETSFAFRRACIRQGIYNMNAMVPVYKYLRPESQINSFLQSLSDVTRINRGESKGKWEVIHNIFRCPDLSCRSFVGMLSVILATLAEPFHKFFCPACFRSNVKQAEVFLIATRNRKCF